MSEQAKKISEMSDYGPNQIWDMLGYTVIRHGRYKREILDKNGATAIKNGDYMDELSLGYSILIQQNVLK